MNVPWNLVYTCVFLTFAGYIAKKFFEYSKVRTTQLSKQVALKTTQINNPLAPYNSLGEMFGHMAQGADMSAKQIRAACEKAGKDPMTDIGFNTQVKNVQRFTAFAEKLQTNQWLMMGDNMLFPIAKDLFPKVPKMLLGFVKELS